MVTKFVKKLRVKPFSNKWYSKRLRTLRLRADYKKVPFNLSIEEIKYLYTALNCFYCADYFVGRTTREIDRLVPENGYTKTNCVMACRDCNRIKGTMVKGSDRLRKVKAVVDKLS